MIKILGGIARGFSLATPQSNQTRPTSVLVRRKLFDWRQNLEGHSFVDLCAGSGAVGLEALSRGAERIVLNDSLKAAYLTLQKNQKMFIEAFKIRPQSILVSQVDALLWLQRELLFQFPVHEDVILFLDPPYDQHGLYFKILHFLKDLGFAGEIWVESDKLKGPMKEDFARLFCSVIKTIEHGDHFVIVGKLI